MLSTLPIAPPPSPLVAWHTAIWVEFVPATTGAFLESTGMLPRKTLLMRMYEPHPPPPQGPGPPSFTARALGAAWSNWIWPPCIVILPQALQACFLTTKGALVVLLTYSMWSLVSRVDPPPFVTAGPVNSSSEESVMLNSQLSFSTPVSLLNKLPASKLICSPASFSPPPQ